MDGKKERWRCTFGSEKMGWKVAELALLGNVSGSNTLCGGIDWGRDERMKNMQCTSGVR